METRRKLVILRKNHSHDGAVTMHSRGGLGNQLFIFGVGLALADQLKSQLYLDSSQHQYTKNLPFVLDNLLPFFPSELQELVRLAPIPSSALRRRLLKKSISYCCSYSESSFRFDPKLFDLPINTCIYGYFQSWRYLEHLSSGRVSDIRSAIHQLGDSSINFESQDIVLHFRRGDYLNLRNREIHGVLSFDYYLRAINQLRGLGFSGNIWSISESKIDDIQLLEVNIGSKVRQIHGLSIWQDLSLLIKAPSLVIANSTFSWMGGWFGPVNRSMVAPSPWFKTETYDTTDLIPLKWHSVSHVF